LIDFIMVWFLCHLSVTSDRFAGSRFRNLVPVRTEMPSPADAAAMQ
jgi:hypothetical protein